MALIDFSFGFPLNTSCQVGDSIYVVDITAQGTSATPIFSGSTSNVTFFGIVNSLTNPTGEESGPIVIQIKHDIDPLPSTFYMDKFFIFSKDKRINTSGITEYYAKVKFENYSTSKDVELFSVGADINLSSK